MATEQILTIIMPMHTEVEMLNYIKAIIFYIV